jgi:hypothetical protein
LGIQQTIWGATCSLGIVEVFSSQWNTDGSVNNLSSFFLSPLAYKKMIGNSVFGFIPTQNGV